MPAFFTDAQLILPYLADESSAFRGHAERLYRPTTVAEIASIVRDAADSKTPLTTSGGGTSITGARVPVGGWIVATDALRAPSRPDTDGRWKRLSHNGATIHLDQDALRARVPAGVRLHELDAMLEPFGLYYPPTLTETRAMIGGTIATNASGARSYRHGATRRWVQALTVVTGAAESVTLRRGEHVACDGRLDLGIGDTLALPALSSPRGVKNAAGYCVGPAVDAVDLFVGGEGTLAIVAEADLGLAPRARESRSLLVFMTERDAALDFADAVRDGLFAPDTALAIEYFDEQSLRFMRAEYANIPDAAAAVLVEIATSEGHETPEGDLLDRASLYGPIAAWTFPASRYEEVRRFRLSLPRRVNEYVAKRYGKLGTDLAVPAGAFRTMMAGYDEAARSGVQTVLFGHLGEYHLHLNFLASDPSEYEQARSEYTRLAELAVSLGGTVSAEHGVGKKRIRLASGREIPYLELMYGAEGMREMRALKSRLDPAMILNRGTMFPVGDD